MVFVEGKKVKGVEGVPVSEKDKERLRRDRELGITHWNNAKDEKPKEKKSKKLSTGKSHKTGGDVELDESAINTAVRDEVVR